MLLTLMHKFGLDVDVTDATGMTSLHHACAHGHKAVAQLLISAGNASTERRDDIYFRNARDWLEECGQGCGDWLKSEGGRGRSFDASQLERVLRARDVINTQQNTTTEARMTCKTAPAHLTVENLKTKTKIRDVSDEQEKENIVERKHQHALVYDSKNVATFDSKNEFYRQRSTRTKQRLSVSLSRERSELLLRTKSAPNFHIKHARVTSASSAATSRSSTASDRHSAASSARMSTSHLSVADVKSSASDDVLLRARHDFDCDMRRLVARTGSGNNVGCSCSRVTHSFFASHTFTELYRLYTEQCSSAFQPSASSNLTTKQSCLSGKKRSSAKSNSSSGSARVRLQRIVRTRRHELTRTHRADERRHESHHDVTSESDESPPRSGNRKRRESCLATTTTNKNNFENRGATSRRKSEIFIKKIFKR